MAALDFKCHHPRSHQALWFRPCHGRRVRSVPCMQKGWLVTLRCFSFPGLVLSCLVLSCLVSFLLVLSSRRKQVRHWLPDLRRLHSDQHHLLRLQQSDRRRRLCSRGGRGTQGRGTHSRGRRVKGLPFLRLETKCLYSNSYYYLFYHCLLANESRSTALPPPQAHLCPSIGHQCLMR